MHTYDQEVGRQIFKRQAEKIGALLEPYDIAADKLQQVLEYAIGIQAKNPLMKQTRIARKTVDYFKLTLKPKPIAQSPESI